jgi:hypothetical protein
LQDHTPTSHKTIPNFLPPTLKNSPTFTVGGNFTLYLNNHQG